MKKGINKSIITQKNWWIMVLSCWMGWATSSIGQLPDDFSVQLVSEGWERAVGLTFDEAGAMYVWEKTGKVYRIDTNGIKQNTPFIDISEEVSDWGDHGLLGFALDPAFLLNRYLYLLYAVDRHHLMHYGTPIYHPDSTTTHQASIGRVSRYTANADFTAILPTSRVVLLGETPETGIPLLYHSHGIGSLVFGTDGSLLVSCGDGASYIGADIGGDETGAYASQALADGILKPDTDIGAFRSQYLGSLGGKILRLDPVTGDGLSSNPFYQANEPRSPASRTWALGLRNPYRMVLKPNSGSHFMGDGNPGVLLIGDVGSAEFEELNIASEPGQNFGWPMSEGAAMKFGAWVDNPPLNQQAPNPLFGTNGCDQAYFGFKDLFQNTLVGITTDFTNPCDRTQMIPASIPTFVETPAAIIWSNQVWNAPTRALVPTLGADTLVEISQANSPVNGLSFDGTSSIPGAFYTADSYPDKYKGAYFNGDFDGKWIRVFYFDDNHVLQSVEPFLEDAGRIVHLTLNERDGCLYFIDYDNNLIKKVCYGGSPPPIAIAKADTLYGGNTLTVQFDATASYTPFNIPMTYHWDFGDGTTSTEPQPNHTFQVSDVAVAPFTVTLTITDSVGMEAQDELVISLNNTPPRIDITSFENGDKYPMDGTTLLQLIASVTDAENTENELTYEWQTLLYHNTHFHAEPIDTTPQTTTLIAPLGCDLETYYYGVTLKVTDKGGLSSKVEQFLYPECGSPFMDFIAIAPKVQDQTIVVNWTTSNEQEVTHYEIQHATDNWHFQPIGTVTATNGIGTINYDFIHEQPSRGDNYYRIKAFNQSRAYRYSPTKDVTYPKPLLVEVYPNPSSHWLNLKIKEPTDIAHFELFDMVGRRKFHTTLEHIANEAIFNIPVNSLPSGLYLYQVQLLGETVTGRVVIQH